MAKPAVDGLERDLQAHGVAVVRLNARQPVGARLAQAYGVRGVPTLVLFDGGGGIALSQVGSVNAGAVLAAVQGF